MVNILLEMIRSSLCSLFLYYRKKACLRECFTQMCNKLPKDLITHLINQMIEAKHQP